MQKTLLDFKTKEKEQEKVIVLAEGIAKNGALYPKNERKQNAPDM